MSEYWKSTPNYWCKFCKTYVRDTAFEKKNHEATPKHQSNIQRSLRELHKNKEREKWETQKAKDEVARLNALVDGKDAKKPVPGSSTTVPKPAPPAPVLSAEAQKRAHAEQLALLGVQLPDNLKRDVSGVGGWQVVSERIVEQPRSLPDFKSETHPDDKSGIKVEDASSGWSRGVHKRKIEGEDEDEAFVPKRRGWGSKIKSYPGSDGKSNDDQDLDALLRGVGNRMVSDSTLAEKTMKKEEPGGEEETAGAALDENDTVETTAQSPEIKREEVSAELPAAPTIVFKKRKAKR